MIQVNLAVRFIVKYGESDRAGCDIACFRHAVLESLSGHRVEVEVDDFSSDEDGRTTNCYWCSDSFLLAKGAPR